MSEDEGGVVENDTGASVTIPVETAASAPQELPAFQDIIPEEYRDEPWVKDIPDIPTLFKITKDTKAMVGSKPGGVPEDTAAPEEWAKFNKALGVPEAPDGYKFSEVPEGQLNPEFQKSMANILHEAGISSRQFQALEPKWNELMGTMAQQSAEAQEAEFAKLSEEAFGTRTDEVMNQGKALLKRFVPEGLQGSLDNATNAQLVAVAAALDNIRKEYISEDQLPDETGNVQMGQSEEEKTQERRKLMATDAYRDPFHPEHKATKEKVLRLSGLWQE